MRSHLSILALWVRKTFWGALLILAVTAGGELGLIWLGLDTVRDGTSASFAVLVTRRAYMWIGFMAGLTALWAWLVYTGCAARRNTLGRLDVSEEKIALWHALCCAGWLAVFWAVQVAVVLMGYRMYRGAADPLSLSGQTLYLACWQSGLLHWLLPLQDLRTAAGIALGVPALGLAAAVDGHCWRRGKRFSSFQSVLPWAILALGPVLGDGQMPWVLLLVLAVMALAAVYRLCRKEVYQ